MVAGKTAVVDLRLQNGCQSGEQPVADEDIVAAGAQINVNGLLRIQNGPFEMTKSLNCRQYRKNDKDQSNGQLVFCGERSL